ncbi:similar to Saccharomyces cerevisiae YGR222W PET54 Mitochondrial inner membrane protein [Maudiozyma barnettii]|uniref:Similar to Saccharomyces cerevisiae YGR222W PET54 Mitochondrial inner membrane protein n=1 Tax=Maudiozyma barnettii TaxID=61262 RepID=A0A8H2ZLG1_9SACH|nr:Pet54p [Kazachstania barnettii]CAB4256102.1 similar to Saccharomyces cerevisiae YGR222W PET54 Mitochondrial inner membrane protein [Kazachstania barnettii]CAD1784710.1 similar to Saccharomyces cerevisiae YGR222W PET54 Mitochondrial inner membrane protein [Kazachstania barnettii]
MKSSKKVITDIVSRISESGKVVGNKSNSKKINPTVISSNNALGLYYKCYNPLLIKQDFVDLLPRDQRSLIDFDFIRKRDPKYFQFNDTYYLLFKNYPDMNKYYNETMMGKINKMRVKLIPLTDKSAKSNAHDKTMNILNKYSMNLSNAYDSGDKYFSGLQDSSTKMAIASMDKLIDIESKSLLVWNLPIKLSSPQIQDTFWFYDIKHCFRMYWNNNNIGSKLSTLHYFAFNNANEAEKFKNNFHGTYFNDDPNQKMLVERL